MKTDSYTKGLLTIIAVCLVLLTINQLGLVPKAYANSPEDFTMAGRYVPVPVNEDGSINVKLDMSDKIQVDISNISTMDKLNINLKEIGGSYVFGGQIPVVVEE